MLGQKNTTIKIELNLTRKTTKDWWNCKKKKMPKPSKKIVIKRIEIKSDRWKYQ
jgi:hypothetical protein